MTYVNDAKANYQESAIQDYRGNPLIEALPPIMSEAQAAQALANYPVEPGAETQLDKELRLHCIGRLFEVLQPLPIHLELESVFSALIRAGYVGRNPMRATTWRHLYSLSQARDQDTGFRSTASAVSLVGLSGIGKSTALEAILRLYPQTIRHSKYGKQEFIQTQIPWLKLECPFDGSLSGLCYAFFRAVDRALGQDRYAPRYRSTRGSIVQLVQKMEQIASTYFIGVLIIDELQHLRVAKTGGKENMLNFFVNLINSIGVPVIFVGTNSMIELFADVLRDARRASGMGLYDFTQPGKDDPAWAMLAEAIWGYQWIREPEPMTESILSTLYDLTQGVTDFLIKLVVLSQRYAILSGLERLSEDVLRHVANTKMQLLRPAISALRSGDPRNMRKFEDLLPTSAQIAQMMNMDNDTSLTAGRVALLGKLRPAASPNNFVIGPGEEPRTEEESTNESTQLEESPAPERMSLAKTLAHSANPGEALREAGWIASDAFEFSWQHRV